MSDLVYIPEFAQRLGKTDSALRAMIHRKSKSIPAAQKIGRKLCWPRATIDRFFSDMEKRARRVKP